MDDLAGSITDGRFREQKVNGRGCLTRHSYLPLVLCTQLEIWEKLKLQHLYTVKQIKRDDIVVE